MLSAAHRRLSAPLAACALLCALAFTQQPDVVHAQDAPVALSAELQTEAQASLHAEVARADAWINALEAAQARKQRVNRWTGVAMLGVLALSTGALAWFDDSTSSRWPLALSALPFAAGSILNLALPQRAQLWTGLALGAGAALWSTSSALAARQASPDDRGGWAGSAAMMAWLSVGSFAAAFMPPLHSAETFRAYAALREEHRFQAAQKLLAIHDRKMRRHQGFALLASLVGVGAAGLAAAITRDRDAFLLGVPAPAGVAFGTLLSLAAYRPLLEAFTLNEPLVPGLVRF